MRLRRALATTMFTLSLSGGAVVALGSPAHAAVPQCVHLSTWTARLRSYAKVTNTCPSTVRVRLIWNHAFDGSCQTLQHNWSYGESRGRQAAVKEMRAC